MIPVINAITIGQGGANNIADAKNGMKTTDEPMRALEIRALGRNDESLAIPRTAKAIRAFQNAASAESPTDGMYHRVTSNNASAATAIAAKRNRKAHLSNLGWLSAISILVHPGNEEH